MISICNLHLISTTLKSPLITKREISRSLQCPRELDWTSLPRDVQATTDLRPTGSPGRCGSGPGCLCPRLAQGCWDQAKRCPALPGPEPGFHAQAAGSRERGRCLDRESGPAHYKPVLENWVRAQRGGGRQKLGKLKYFWKLWWIIFWN